MIVTQLTSTERLQGGFTHRAVIDFNDLVAKGATTTGTFDLHSYIGGRHLYGPSAYKLVTPFDGGATSNLALDVGHNGGTTDDPDGMLDNYELHADATEVNSGEGNGAIYATLRSGYAPQDSGVLQALFTATGGNLNALTQGKVAIFFTVIDLTALSPAA